MGASARLIDLTGVKKDLSGRSCGDDRNDDKDDDDDDDDDDEIGKNRELGAMKSGTRGDEIGGNRELGR